MSKPCVSSLSTPRLGVQVTEILDPCVWHDVCTIGSMSIFAKLGAMGAPSTWSAQATLGRLLTFTGLLFTLSGCASWATNGMAAHGLRADGVIRGDVESFIPERCDCRALRRYNHPRQRCKPPLCLPAAPFAGNLGLGRSREGKEQGLDLDYRTLITSKRLTSRLPMRRRSSR